MTLVSRSCGLALVVACLLIAQNGVQRTVVQRGDVSVAGRESVIARIEIAAGASTGRHTHPGDENTYVIEGELEITMDGQPTRTVKPGEAFIIPSGVVHNARNTGSQPVRAVGVYVVEKVKPLATPAT